MNLPFISHLGVTLTQLFAHTATLFLIPPFSLKHKKLLSVGQALLSFALVLNHNACTASSELPSSVPHTGGQNSIRLLLHRANCPQQRLALSAARVDWRFCALWHTLSPCSALLTPGELHESLRGPYFRCFLFPIQTRADYLFPLLHLIYKKHTSWVTLNKRQNCFYSVFTDNKMNLSSKQTVHNVPYY